MPKILIADDEPQILTSTASLLEAAGFEVVTTSDHREVLDLARLERPDALLQDVRMPGLDIGALVQRLRADTLVGELPIILFSASLDLMEVRDEVGATESLEKPFRPADLFAAIARACAAKSKESELVH